MTQHDGRSADDPRDRPWATPGRAGSLSRRQWLTLSAGLPWVLSPRRAGALTRTPHGGMLRLSLPISTRQIDPHDPFDLTAALLGPALFEPLYQRLSTGQVYPTLALGMPRAVGGSISVELRDGLRAASGTALDGPAVAAALRRAQRAQTSLGALGEISGKGTRVVFSGTLSPEQVARLLSATTSAVVSGDFHPTHPSGTGALFCRGNGVSSLVRNPWGPRGGSYVDGVTVRSGDLRSCLRDFEKGSSHVGLLSSGLYQGVTAKPFTLGRLGSLLLLVGQRLGNFAAPGVITEELSRTPRAGLESLGVRALLPGAPATYRGPPLIIDVDGSQPWLLAIAEEIARVWSHPRKRVIAQARSPAVLALRRKSGDFDVQLCFLRSSDPVALHTDLFALDGTPPPRSYGVRSGPSLEWTARRLRLGFVGFLEARGALDPGLRDISSKGNFALENTFFAPSLD